MKKRVWNKVLSMLTALLLVIGIVPMTATTTFAAGNAPATLYVGETQITGSGYWTTDANGKLVAGDASNYNVYYDGNGTLTLNNATIQGGTSTGSVLYGAGIYAQCNSGESVSLTIELIGENTITGYYGIYVNAEISADSNGTDASLTITGENNGSLEVSGSNHGIFVKSGTGNASLNIEKATVTSSTNGEYAAGVNVQSSANATGSPNISLSVNGGSLTASGTGNSDGILFYVGQSQATGATTSLTITDHSIVDARNGGISASRISETLPTPTPTGNNSNGIVFDGTEGTVYGDVTLQDDLTIDQGETLTIPKGSTLNTNGNLINNGTIVNSGGTLIGEPGGTIISAPSIITESLSDGMVGQSYTAMLEAIGNNITWSASDLPAGLMLDADTGVITGTPTADGQFQVTISATNNVGGIDRTYTLNIKPATVFATGLKLSSESLTLQEKESNTLTVTVEPADATNKAVTWASSDNNIATVSEDGTVTAISAGNATITATAADGSGVSASCAVTITHGNIAHTPSIDATCTNAGSLEYWTCESCGKHFADKNCTDEITDLDAWKREGGNGYVAPLGHEWQEPIYTWSDDKKSCTAKRICIRDNSHQESADATVSQKQSQDSTCIDKGKTTYTATFKEAWATTQTVTLENVDAIGHEYGEPVWNWSEDGKECTLIFTCENDLDHQITLNADVIGIVEKSATCTELGVTKYTARAEFAGQIYTSVKGVADIPALGHDYEDGKCVLCGSTDTDFEVKITSGSNLAWKKGSSVGLTFTSNASFADFLKVQVDGKDLSGSNYTVKSGSTIVTLKPSYLETLSSGKHTFAIVSKTGVAKTTFTIEASTQTAYRNNVNLWISLLGISAVGFMLCARKRNE